MKKVAVVGLALLLLLLSGCDGSAAPTEAPDLADYVPMVSVTGEAVPAAWATISTQSGGTVMEVLVEPGDEVAEGDTLVLLDPTDAELTVSQAQAALQAAQAQLALLEAGARAEDVATAEAQLEAAQAALAQSSGTTEAEIAAARAQLAAAEAEQQAAREAHDQTIKCYTMPDGSESCPGLGTPEEQARYALHAADEAVAAAQAQLDALLTEDGRIGAADATVWAAAAQRDIAQAQLDLLQAGATEEEIAVAEAAVAQAESALEAAQVALDRTKVLAPFDGTVGLVSVRMGELVAPGQPLVTLGDLTTLRVETTDLDEIDVARVTVGQRATVTFDALPEQVFGGRVTRISPMADPGSGGVHYDAVVELDEIAPSVRWGMTAFVDIEVEE